MRPVILLISADIQTLSVLNSAWDQFKILSSSCHVSLEDLIYLEIQWVVCVYIYSQFEGLCLLWLPLFNVLKYTEIHLSKLLLFLYSLLETTCLLQTFSAPSDFDFKIFTFILFTFLLFSYKGNWNWFREPFKEHFSRSEFSSLWLKTMAEQWRKSKHFGLYRSNYHFKNF